MFDIESLQIGVVLGVNLKRPVHPMHKTFTQKSFICMNDSNPRHCWVLDKPNNVWLLEEFFWQGWV
jgi:hypothetical protein